LEPEDEDRLEGEIPGQIVEDGTEREALKEIEETKDNPVSEPLDVVGCAGRFESFEWQVSGQGPADEVGNGPGEWIDKVEEGKKGDTAKNKVGLGHLSALLQGVQDGIFRELQQEVRPQMRNKITIAYLLVELAHIIIGLVLCLLDDRVLLDTLSCRHLKLQTIEEGKNKWAGRRE
jgi:hypothetical protein